jgi:hypothetical protein
VRKLELPADLFTEVSKKQVDAWRARSSKEYPADLERLKPAASSRPAWRSGSGGRQLPNGASRSRRHRTPKPWGEDPDLFGRSVSDAHTARTGRRPETAAITNLKGRFTKRGRVDVQRP